MLSPGESGHEDLSQLLVRWTEGDKEALQSLIPIVYDELRKLAHKHLRQEYRPQTLQTSTVVHEAYLRLAKHSPRTLRDRKQFFAMASSIMRQVLVDHARERRAQKRDGGIRVELTPDLAPVGFRELDVIALDRALCTLARLDRRQSQIVELRFFAGLSIEETSELLGTSPATVKRDWITARTWLRREMSRTTADSQKAGAGSAP